MGKKITQYPNNVSTNPDNLSLLDLSEKTGASTFESRKWNLTAFKAWVNSWVVAGVVAWNDITGKPTTLSGYGITDAIDGNGTNNYVAKFTPDGNTIGNSQIQDNGTNVSIGTTLDPDRKVNILTNEENGIYLENTRTTGGTGVRVEITTPTLAGSHFGFYTTLNDALNSYGLTAIVTATNHAVGVSATASNGILNKGLYGSANSNLNTPNTNHGVEGYAFGGDKSYGGRFEARNGSTHSVGIWAQVPPTSVIGNKYSVQLEDGTEAVGKFLKSVTSDGKANWANITASDVQGAVGAVNGTNNYIAKFTPNGTTIGNSLIEDNGTSLGINTSPSSGGLVKVSSSSQGTTLLVYNTKTTANAQGVYVNVSAGDGKGGGFYVNGTSGENIALIGSVTGVGATKNVGGDFIASGATNNYSIRLSDGTQAENKFLKSVTATGEANWSYLPTEIQLAVSDETTALTTGTGKITFRMPYTMFVTEVRASLTTAQTSGNIFTVNIKENVSSILSTKLTIDNNSKTSVGATTPYVISDSTLADDAEITIDIDQIGNGTAKGLKVLIKGLRIS